MTLLASIQYLLDLAEGDGYEIDPDTCDITVDRDAFWKEMEREGLKVSEPYKAFGHTIILKSDFGKLQIDGFHEHKTYELPIADWKFGEDEETLKQATWRQYKTLPDNMKSMEIVNLIYGAETLQQATAIAMRVSSLWFAACWRKVAAVF
jgi:hypothetical protein